MKAISPLIAVVLLITVVMGIYALLTAWLTPWTKEYAERHEKEAEKITFCSGGYVNLRDLELNSTSLTLSGIIENGEVPLKNLTLQILYENGTVQLIELNLTLDKHQIKSFSVTAASNIMEIILTTECANIKDKERKEDIKVV